MNARPKKSLGQHFLRSKTALVKMVGAAHIEPDDVVLEIGPGRGVLTEALLASGATVVAVETDRSLIPELMEKFGKESAEKKFFLIEGDVLDKKVREEMFSSSFLGEKPYKVVANIPYYITGLLFRLFLEESRQPVSLTFLVQKEVAEQVVARDGKEGILSLSVKVFGEPRYVTKVSRESFSPPPKVDSAVVHIADISQKKLAGLSAEDFFRVMKAGMSSRRKMLLGNLAEKLSLSRLALEEVFSEAGIPLRARGEDVSIDAWIQLARLVKTKDRS